MWVYKKATNASAVTLKQIGDAIIALVMLLRDINVEYVPTQKTIGHV
jgi:hypothetical protein